jgi:GPH family glycoside/pentoside/hexuronide:cation symporter
VGPGTVIPFWYTFFLTDVARLDLHLVSLFWLVVTIWDAVNDPLVGFLSDRTRTRWGRRRPYLLWGAIPFGASFALLWRIPPTQDQMLLFAYYTVTYVVFETAFTAVSCPHVALTPELTQDHDERTSLVSYRMAVNIAAGLAAPLFLGFVIFPQFPERDPAAYRTIGLLLGASFAPPLIAAFLGTRERADFQEARPLPVRETVRFVARNYALRYTLSIRILSWMPVVIAQAIFAYFLVYWTGMTEDETSLVQGVILAVSLMLLPLVLWLARRLEKKTAYIIAAASWAVVMLAILLVPQGAKLPAYAIAALAGFGVSAAHLLPRSMEPDVLEVDELMSGRRQEGAYAGIAVFADKLARAAVLALLPAVLAWAGYVQPTPEDPAPLQPASALNALRLLMSVLPALLLAASIAVAWRYPLTRERYSEIRRKLASRPGSGRSERKT